MVVRGYAFTRFEPEQYEMPLRGIIGQHGVSYIVVGRETCPTSGREHLQGYLQTTSKNHARINAQFNLVLTKQIATAQQAADYCKKEGNWWEAGVFDASVPGSRQGQGKRTDIDAVKKAIDDGMTYDQICDKHFAVVAPIYKFIQQRIQSRDCGKLLSDSRERSANIVLRPLQQSLLEEFQEDPHPRKIIWIYDKRGGAGKSVLAQVLTDHHQAVLFEAGKKADLAYIWASKPGKIAIFDLPRTLNPEEGKSIMDHLYSLAESLKNGYLISTKYESRAIRFPVPHVAFFANFPPQEGKWSEDRYDVREI